MLQVASVKERDVLDLDTTPEIELAPRQMCMDAMSRSVEWRGGVPMLDKIAARSGHCFCQQGVLREIVHRVCCKCLDRYVVEPDPD